MLEVPARTLGMSADWRARRWSAGLALARAWDWVNYDRLALAGLVAEADAAGLPASRLPLGAPLRDYWRTYDGVTRLGARTTVALARGLSLTLAGENLLDHQVGEPDNVTVIPGRTISVGVRTGF